MHRGRQGEQTMAHQSSSRIAALLGCSPRSSTPTAPRVANKTPARHRAGCCSLRPARCCRLDPLPVLAHHTPRAAVSQGAHDRAPMSTKLTGDVSEVDGLNHYIGMMKLNDAAAIERQIALAPSPDRGLRSRVLLDARASGSCWRDCRSSFIRSCSSPTCSAGFTMPATRSIPMPR